LLPEFHVIVQRPLAAQNFQHSLDDPEELAGDFGLIFFRPHIPELLAGIKYPISLTYENPTGALTMSMLQERMEQAQAEAAEHPEISANPSNLTLTLIVIGGLAVLLIVVLRFWNGKKVTPGKTEVAEKGTTTDTQGPKIKVADTDFCSNCGSPSRVGAKFCPDCGKEL
ncbi:MAG: zinc ribbon domain-containing protein, partial [Fidelibacterota bacterium]